MIRLICGIFGHKSLELLGIRMCSRCSKMLEKKGKDGQWRPYRMKSPIKHTEKERINA